MTPTALTTPATLDDVAFLAAFLDASLPATAFDHRGHVRAAWLLLQRHPLETAATLCCEGIAGLAAHFGAPGKYHRTLTEAFLRLMASCGACDRTLSWPDFQESNTLLMADARRLLARHYSEQRLSDPAARERFLQPDLLPLPTCEHASLPLLPR